jgi:hypothetical protein
MKKYIQASPAEVMLIELAMGEYNKLLQLAEEQKQHRLAAVANSHPEAKSYNFESKDGNLCLVYDAPDEKTAEESAGPQTQPVPPVKKSKRNVL